MDAEESGVRAATALGSVRTSVVAAGFGIVRASAVARLLSNAGLAAFFVAMLFSATFFVATLFSAIFVVATRFPEAASVDGFAVDGFATLAMPAVFRELGLRLTRGTRSGTSE